MDGWMDYQTIAYAQALYGVRLALLLSPICKHMLPPLNLKWKKSTLHDPIKCQNISVGRSGCQKENPILEKEWKKISVSPEETINIESLRDCKSDLDV